MKKRMKTLGILALSIIMLISTSTGALAVEESWSTVASMSTDRYNFQTEVIDGKIYAIGGHGTSSKLSSAEVYDQSTDTWTTLASMSIARNALQTEVVNGKIYAFGGVDNSNTYLSSAEVYDPSTDTWTTLASMSTARYYSQTQVINGKIYAIGGSDGYNYLSSVEVYDPATNIWTTLASMSIARHLFQTEVVDGKIYAIGGKASTTTTVSSVEVYDPSSDTWTTLASMSTDRYHFGTEVIGGKIYAIGGHSTSSSLLSSEVYDPAANTWTTLASMSIARYIFKTEIVDGKIYAVGGKDSSSTTLSLTEVYDPAANTWTTLDSMLTARYIFRTEVVDGKIYAMGGSGASSVEVYTPASSIHAPSLTVTTGDSQVDLYWTSVDEAVSYNVFRSGISGDEYIQIETGVANTTYTDTNVTNGTTYYYVVTAVDSSATESGYSNEVSATPQADGNALLRIIMNNGEEKEYDVTMEQARTFISWFDNGADNAFYSMNNANNVGMCSSRIDYLAHDKIVYFEVMAYDTDTTNSIDEVTNTNLIRITVSNGAVIEFETTIDELSTFTAWVSGGGTDNSTYVINKAYNLGPFDSRTMYVVFDKISSVEIIN